MPPQSSLCSDGRYFACHTEADMGFLLLLARSFINTFGITQPGPATERRAAYFIGGLLFLIVAALIAVLVGFISIHR